MRQMSYKPCESPYFQAQSLGKKPNETFKKLMFKIKVRDIGIETVKILEANYPEDLSKVIVINGRLSTYQTRGIG